MRQSGRSPASQHSSVASAKRVAIDSQIKENISIHQPKGAPLGAPIKSPKWKILIQLHCVLPILRMLVHAHSQPRVIMAQYVLQYPPQTCDDNAPLTDARQGGKSLARGSFRLGPASALTGRWGEDNHGAKAVLP
jgi:hypothetical protein